MDVTSQAPRVSRGPYELYAEVAPGEGVPVVLMHGFPDNTHLYDRLVPHLTGRRPVVRFEFLGWGRSDKPAGYPYTAANQAGDLAVVADADGRSLFMTSPAMHTHRKPVRPDNAVLLLVDQQEGLFSRIHEPQQTRANLVALPGRPGCWGSPRS
jgi:hypothetical protein